MVHVEVSTHKKKPSPTTHAQAMLSLVENSQRKLSEVIKLLYNHAQNLGLQSKIPKSCNFSYFHIGFLHDLGLANAKESF